MVNNGPLVALALLKNIEPLIKLDKRAQIDKTGLRTAYDLMGSALNKINESGINDFHAMAYLTSARECIESVLDDSTFVETDTALKKIIMDKVYSAIDALYVPIGEYYMTNEFRFAENMRSILNEVIDSSITKGQYFGYDKKRTGGLL